MVIRDERLMVWLMMYMRDIHSSYLCVPNSNGKKLQYTKFLYAFDLTISLEHLILLGGICIGNSLIAWANLFLVLTFLYHKIDSVIISHEGSEL